MNPTILDRLLTDAEDTENDVDKCWVSYGFEDVEGDEEGINDQEDNGCRQRVNTIGFSVVCHDGEALRGGR